MNQWRNAVVMVMMVVATAALAGCSTLQEAGLLGGGAEAPVVTIAMGDEGLSLPAEVPSGVVTFQVPAEMEALAGRLNDGVTLDQLNEALTQPDPFAAFGMLSLLGGTSTGIDNQVTFNLKPGTHALVGFSESGPSVVPFEAGEPSPAEAPAADVAATLVDFNFDLPAEIKAGPQTWQVTNGGSQWHEMAVVKLDEGQTVDDLLELLNSADQSGPPPIDDVAFWGPMSPGESGWVNWDLPAGTYTLLCFLPDAADGTPHVVKGMVRELTVTE